MNDPDLNEAMDACRPNSDDLQQPELKALASALENDPQLRRVFFQRKQIDERVAARLHDVAMSPALRARLIAAASLLGIGETAVTTEAPATTSDATVSADTVPTSGPSPLVPRPSRRPAIASPQYRRRRFLAAAAVGLTALSVILVAMLSIRWLQPWRTVSPQQLARWTMQDWSPQPNAWKPMNQLSRTQQRMVSRYLRVHPARWQPLVTHLDHQAVVFDLPGHRMPARLFVLRAGGRAKRLPTSPPQQPQTRYEQQFFAAWQEARHVYVLSVAGTVQNYHDLVHAPGQSLAESGSAGMLAE